MVPPFRYIAIDRLLPSSVVSLLSPIADLMDFPVGIPSKLLLLDSTDSFVKLLLTYFSKEIPFPPLLKLEFGFRDEDFGTNGGGGGGAGGGLDMIKLFFFFTLSFATLA